jgi:hypothetical protein
MPRLLPSPPRADLLRRLARQSWTGAVDALLTGDRDEWSRLRRVADAYEAQARELDAAACRGVAKAITRILDFAATDSAPKGAA